MGLTGRGGPSGFLYVLVASLVVLVTVMALEPTANAGSVTTASVLTNAKAAIDKESGAHVAFVAHAGSSSTTERIVADVGVTSGVETVSEGKSELTVKVTPTDAYASGNSSGLTTLFGMSSADAKKVGKDWESWRAGTSQYTSLRSDLTLSSVTALLPKAKGTRLTTEITKGSRLYVLKWTTPATSSLPGLSNTLTISASGAALPVEETSTASGGTKATTSLSKWSEPVLVSAPPAASTIASSKVTG